MRISQLSVAAAALAVTASLSLSACSSSESGDFCEVLLSDTAAAATVFTPPATQIGDVEAIQARVDLLSQVEEPPDVLTEPLQLWTEWLSNLRDTWETDPTDIAASVDTTAEVDAAREQLFDYYIETCMA